MADEFQPIFDLLDGVIAGLLVLLLAGLQTLFDLIVELFTGEFGTWFFGIGIAISVFIIIKKVIL